MPKFLVTNGSNFQPFTYEEITRPLYEMAEAQRTSQDQYDALSMQTEALRNYITDNPGDKQAKQMYDNYVNKLQSLQDNLWRNGYNTSTRRDLVAARAGFFSDINRIGKAIENRQARSAEYNKFKHEHPDMVMGEDPGLSGLDAYLGNDLYGTNWYQYSGDQFTKEVAADAGARLKEMFDDPEISRTIPGYITIKKQQGVTSDDVAKANAGVLGFLNGDTNALNNLDPVQNILAKVLLEHLDSTGAAGQVTQGEFSRLTKYGMAGLSAAIGTSDTSYMQDPVYMANLDFSNWKRKEEQKRKWAKDDAEGKSSDNKLTTGSEMARLRGNNLNGIATKKQAKEFEDKTNVYESLDIINKLKKSGALRNPDGTLSDAATDALMRLNGSKYYKSLTKGEDHYLSNADLDQVLNTLGNELNSAVTNDHLYSFNVKPTAAKNIAHNVFKLNIGELSGKRGDKLAASFARYNNGKPVSAKDLMSIMDADNLDIGFDASTGKITMQRKGADSSSTPGKYDDKIMMLDTKYLLSGTSGYVNLAALMYTLNQEMPDNVSTSGKDFARAMLSSMATVGQTVNLGDLAELISSNYDSMVKNGDEESIAVFNALVESFAQGLYDSANTEWAPNDYKEGWSVNSGGQNIYGYYNENE